MINPTFIDFGAMLLRKMIQRSRILDLWKAEQRDASSGVTCLVRRMLPPYTQGPEFVQTFLSRVHEVERARLPGALPVLESGDVDGIPFAVFASVHGWTLQELIDAQSTAGLALPITVALQYMLPVARALQAAHSQPARSPDQSQAGPLVHGAVRPRSIWVASDGTILLSDFDIGALAEIELTSSEGQEERAWRFQAPERPDDWAHPDPSADVFSVCAIVLELLAIGRLSQVQIKLDGIDQLPVLATAGLPNPLLELLERGLSEAPDERPAMDELVRGLELVASQHPGALPLTAHLAKVAPPIEELDPLAKKPIDGDRFLKKSARRKVEPKVVQTEMATGTPSGEPPHRSRATFLAAMLAVLLLGGAIVFRSSLKHIISTPGGDMALAVINSTPEGATIEIAGGKSIGVTPMRTPVHIGPDGKVSLTARLEGYKPLGPLNKEAHAGDEVTFDFVLEVKPEGPATAHIDSDPPGARITVDGKARGVTPLDVEALDSRAAHKLMASLAGYRAETQTFRVEFGQITPVQVKLAKTTRAPDKPGGSPTAAREAGPASIAPDVGIADYNGPVGYLLLESTPVALVTIDGAPRGKTGTGRKTVMPVGRHSIEYVAWDSHKSAKRDVTVRSEETQVLEYDFVNGGWRLKPYRPF